MHGRRQVFWAHVFPAFPHETLRVLKDELMVTLPVVLVPRKAVEEKLVDGIDLLLAGLVDLAVPRDVFFHSLDHFVDVDVFRVLGLELSELISEIPSLLVEVFEVSDFGIHRFVILEELLDDSDEFLLVLFAFATLRLVLAHHFHKLVLGSHLVANLSSFLGAGNAVLTQAQFFYLRSPRRLDSGGLQARHRALVTSSWAFARHVLFFNRFGIADNVFDFVKPLAANFFNFFLCLLLVLLVMVDSGLRFRLEIIVQGLDGLKFHFDFGKGGIFSEFLVFAAGDVDENVFLLLGCTHLLVF